MIEVVGRTSEGAAILDHGQDCQNHGQFWRFTSRIHSDDHGGGVVPIGTHELSVMLEETKGVALESTTKECGTWNGKPHPDLPNNVRAWGNDRMAQAVVL